MHPALGTDEVSKELQQLVTAIHDEGDGVTLLRFETALILLVVLVSIWLELIQHLLDVFKVLILCSLCKLIDMVW
jgi:hypothetical protein